MRLKHRSLRPSANPSERDRFLLSKRLFTGFTAVLEANQLTIEGAKEVKRPLRLSGMKELRAETNLTDRTFRNWWKRFKRRPRGLFRPKGRRYGFAMNSLTSRCVKWLDQNFERLFRGLALHYSTRELWHACRKAKGFPPCSQRTFRRALERAKHRSKTQWSWYEKQPLRKRRARYLREREKLLAKRRPGGHTVTAGDMSPSRTRTADSVDRSSTSVANENDA